MADNFSALRTSRGEPSLFEQVRTAAQITPEAQYEMTSGASDTQFEKGLRSGAAGLTAGSFANEALSQEVGGDANWQRSRDLALQTQAQGQMYAPRVSSLRDIGSLEDAGDFAAGAIGQGAMSMAPTLATALLTRGRGKYANVGSYAGGAATAYNLERGEAALNQYADPTLAAASAEDRDFAATTKGVINAGLEAIVPAGLAGSLLRRPAGSLMGHVGREALTEGLTEAAQQGVGFGAEKHLDPNRQLDPWDVADAFAAGALTGGGMSGAVRGPAHGAQALVDRFARGQQGDAAPIDLNPPSAPMEGAPPGTPLLPGPEDGSGGGIGDLFDTLNERFGPSVREQAQRTKDYVSDTIDRMNEAAKTARDPGDFLRQVFGNVSEEAAADLRPDTEDPSVLNAADPAAAIRQRDVERQQRAVRYAEELLNDPSTPEAIKARVASFGGDFTNPEAQAFVSRSLVAQRGGEKLATAVFDLIDSAKEIGKTAAKAGSELTGKARSTVEEGVAAAADRIVRKNLQDATPAEQAAFDKLIFDNLTDEARANPTVRQRLPDIANAMLAFAARTGDLTKADIKTLSRIQDSMTLFRDPDAVTAQLTKYAGLPRTEDSFLARVKRVTNAQQDTHRPNSFLYSALTEEAKDTLRAPQLKQLARLVDDFTLSDYNKARGEKLLNGLTAAFGSKENAKAVLDYYQQQNHADVRFDPNETLVGGSLTETDSAPSHAYHFSDAKTLRPFRAFSGVMNNEGGMRRRLRESTVAGIALRRSSPDGARVRPIKMSQYVEETGGNPEAEVKRIAADIQKRIDQHKARKGEDRSKQINQLQGELSLMRQAYREGGAKATLDLYEVLRVSEQEQNNTVASDEDIARGGTLLSRRVNPNAPPKGMSREDAIAHNNEIDATRVTFQRVDGSKFSLSAESMWKAQGDKEGSGKGENVRSRAKRLFADAVASVLARPEVDKMVTPITPKLLLDRENQIFAKRAPQSDARRAAAEKERTNRVLQGRTGTPTRRAMLRERIDELTALIDDGEPAYGEAVNELVDRMHEASRTADRRVEEGTARASAMWKEALSMPDGAEKDDAVSAARAAQARVDVDREVANDFRDALETMEGIQFEADFDERDNNRSGIPGADERGPLGTNGLPRTRLNMELSNAGPRYSEEDTGLGVGVEKRGRKVEAPVTKKSAMDAEEGSSDKTDQQKITDEIRRIRGDKIKVIFQKFSEIGGSGEFSMNKDKTDRLIKIAVNASNPMGAAWHESLHDFFAMLNEDRAGRSIKKDLIDAAEAPHVKKKLRELLDKHPEALKQIEESAEERVAYMYQFWAEGLLHLGPTGTGIFARIRQLFRDLFGVVGTDQRAEDLLTALHSGKFADPSVVAEVLADMPGDRFTNKMEKAAPELTAALNKVFSAAPDRLRGYQNDALNTLADMFSSERGKLGFIQNRFQQQGVWENKLASILDGTTAQERRAALENLQAMKEPSSALEKQLARFFGELHGYMVEAGVKTLDSKTKKWVPLREVKNYFPRMFDRQALMADREGFISLLQKHGGMDLKQANAAFEALTRGTGQLDLAENEHALGFTPYAQAVQDRRFTFINPSNAPEFAKYQVKDLADTTTSYVKQAVHRAEYARMFGNSGEVITKLISESGIKDSKELEDISKVVRGLEGTLGSDMSVATKELMSGVMTLQNLVVLPLALFSQMVDPIVLAARSGDLKDAGNAFATAIKRLAGNKVDGEELASMLGIISQDSVLEAMGVAYGTAHMSGRMRSINRVFFKYNGMQGWNSSMRIAATVAGERYLLANKNNEKVLAEFGLVPSDIKTVLSAEFQKADARGNRPLRERLEVDNPKVQQALFRFVDEAVLRPSASNRPVWVSDPRFLLVAHLKQFTFAMQNVVLKRANRELAEGNPKPWGVLMLAMPVILAADMAKFALAGNVPTGWGFKDYLVHAVERSGLLGLGDFHVQATYGVDRGKMPGEGLLGPTFEHLMEILRWLGGDPRTSVEDVIDRTVPGARFI